MVTVAVSGGFDPIHPGHTRHIKAAMALGDKLIVILTRDDQLVAKKGSTFHPNYEERKEIVEYGLRPGDEVVPNLDKTIASTESIRKYHPDVYAKGGNTWDESSLPELDVCRELGIQVVFGIGGREKVQSSSWLTGIGTPKTIHNPTTGKDYPVTRRRHG